MRGLSAWMRSQVKPMRSSAPGAKFSARTSQVLIRRSMIFLPRGFLESTVIDRLLWLSMVKYRLSALGTSRNCPRVMSPTPGRSILITSAPNQASSWVQVGPDCTWVKSRMRTPSRALPAAPQGSLLGAGARGAAALRGAAFLAAALVGLRSATTRLVAARLLALRLAAGFAGLLAARAAAFDFFAFLGAAMSLLLFSFRPRLADWVC